MTMTQFSLVAAIGWGVVVAAAALGSTRLRRRQRTRAGPAAAGGPAPAITVVDLVVGGCAGLVAFGGILLGVHLTVRFTIFGSIAITYLVLVVGVPLAVVAVLAGSVAGRGRDGASSRGRVLSRPALGGVPRRPAPRTGRLLRHPRRALDARRRPARPAAGGRIPRRGAVAGRRGDDRSADPHDR